jgi:hypothetical protein
MFFLPDEPEFAFHEARHLWFLGVLLAECGELAAMPPDAEVPSTLNWMRQVPFDRQFDVEEAECALVFVGEDGYSATVWDATGENDDPWAVFLVDDYGARLLSEYSVFDEDASEEERNAKLLAASTTLQDRLQSGEFTRTGTPVSIPDYLFDVENLIETV